MARPCKSAYTAHKCVFFLEYLFHFIAVIIKDQESCGERYTDTTKLFPILPQVKIYNKERYASNKQKRWQTFFNLCNYFNFLR